METFRIGEVSRRVGLRPSAIRFYESEGLVAAAPRHGGRRVFDGASVARLQAIRTARQAGFSLEEIRQLLMEFPPETPPPERWRALARAKLPEIDRQIQRALALRRLLQAGMSCQCVSIEECFLDDCSQPRAPRALPIVPQPRS